jgi:hypothetical protein
MARRSVRNLPGVIAGQHEYLAKLSADRATAETHADDAIVIAGHPCPRADVIVVLGNHLSSLPTHVGQTTPVPIGRYRGLTFGLVLRPGFPPDVYLEGAVTCTSLMGRGNPGPRAVLNALEHLGDEYAAECDRIRQNIAITQGQLRDYQARVGQPFTHDAYLTELTALRDQLRDGLSGTTPATGEATSVAKLVEQIRSIKLASNVALASKQVRHNPIGVPESIVTRIHRRLPARSDEHREQSQASIALQPPMSFQQRVSQASRSSSITPASSGTHDR